jgi:RNA polymerase sigma factor (sigma-70 family)
MIDVAEAIDDAFLSPRERKVVELVVNESMTAQEVAEALGVGESSVRTMMNRACAKISEYMRESEETK